MSLWGWSRVAFQLTRRVLYGIKSWAGVPNTASNLIKLFWQPVNNVPNAVPARSPNIVFKAFRIFFRNIGIRHYIRPFSMIDHNRIRFSNDRTSKRFRIFLPKPHYSSTTELIKDFFVRNIHCYPHTVLADYPSQLDAYEIGKNIGCGCHAAVYELRLVETKGQKTNKVYNRCTLNDLSQDSGKIDEIDGRRAGDKHFPLALKIMFNYEYIAPEHSLWSRMGTELVPLLKNDIPITGRMKSLKRLSEPHPNVIKMYTAFIDRMPILPDAHLLYPEALPTSNLCELAINEPATLLIVMKRYRMTLRQYALVMKRNLWKGRVMYGQLLEAVAYLYDQTISHRDLKSDNILLDFDSEEDTPHLVICDFGCALATGSWIVDYPDDSVDLGGNLALRAPEVRCAQPGPLSFVDFRLADLWASATLGYEIFTRCNPFYSRMSSYDYLESELPELPRRVHYAVRAVTRQILSRDSRKRPSPHVAANVVNISLFRFGESVKKVLDDCGLEELMLGDEVFDLTNSVHKALNMLKKKVWETLDDLTMLYAAETIMAHRLCPKVISRAELELRATFLSRLNRSEIRGALGYFFINNDFKEAVC